MPSESEESDKSSSHSSSDVKLTKNRKKRLKAAFNTDRKKRKDVLKPYTKFAQWYTRSQNLVVNWFKVLDKGIAWDNHDYGKLERHEFARKCDKPFLDVYTDLNAAVPVFEKDMPFFEKNPECLDDLVKAMISASGSARSNDISSLKDKCLVYTAQAYPSKQLTPLIPPQASKSARGFNHPQLAWLLCPIKLIENFDANPEEFKKQLANGTIKVRAHDMPSFLWAEDAYDPDHIEYGMFQNPVLVMVFKHIFTSPSSALEDNPGQTKTKGSQAKRHKMTSVTSGSIAYICVQYCHGISTVKDWRIDDRLFDRDKFFDAIVKLFYDAEDEDPEWHKDTFNWWNA